jgi:hypothetical protein
VQQPDVSSYSQLGARACWGSKLSEAIMPFPHARRALVAGVLLRGVAAHDAKACREWGHPKEGKWQKDEDCPCAARTSRDGNSPADTRRLRGGSAGRVRGRVPLREG